MQESQAVSDGMSWLDQTFKQECEKLQDQNREPENFLSYHDQLLAR